jgi:hypothetical protein
MQQMLVKTMPAHASLGDYSPHPKQLHCVLQGTLYSYLCMPTTGMTASMYAPPRLCLQFIMHDWGDEDCVKILKNARAAVKPGGRIIILDQVLQMHHHKLGCAEAAAENGEDQVRTCMMGADAGCSTGSSCLTSCMCIQGAGLDFSLCVVPG